MNTRKKPQDSPYRAQKTLEFIQKHIQKDHLAYEFPILDIGQKNFVGDYIGRHLPTILINTGGDLDYSWWDKPQNHKSNDSRKYYTVFCFETLEHLTNPGSFLTRLHDFTINTSQVFLSTPSRPKFLWNDEEHFHEIDKHRLAFLFEKTGWEIVDQDRIRIINTRWDYLKYFKGFRPLLRLFFDFTNIYELRKG